MFPSFYFFAKRLITILIDKLVQQIEFPEYGRVMQQKNELEIRE
jgi:hypothetical protein